MEQAGDWELVQPPRRHLVMLAEDTPQCAAALAWALQHVYKPEHDVVHLWCACLFFWKMRLPAPAACPLLAHGLQCGPLSGAGATLPTAVPCPALPRPAAARWSSA